jgi:hypothetical protein
VQGQGRLQGDRLLSRATFFALLVCGACDAPSGAPTTATGSASAATQSASPAERVSQCTDVLTVVVRAAKESKDITGHISGDGTKELESLSASAKRAKADVERIAVTDPTLAAARDRYAAMLGSMSSAAADVVAAARGQDFDKLEAANTALTKAVDAEPMLVEAIQRACASP